MRHDRSESIGEESLSEKEDKELEALDAANALKLRRMSESERNLQ